MLLSIRAPAERSWAQCDFIAVFATPFDRAIGGSAVKNKDLIEPGAVYLWKDRLHSVNLVRRKGNRSGGKSIDQEEQGHSGQRVVPNGLN
jgi:hypothetical protein